MQEWPDGHGNDHWDHQRNEHGVEEGGPHRDLAAAQGIEEKRIESTQKHSCGRRGHD